MAGRVDTVTTVSHNHWLKVVLFLRYRQSLATYKSSICFCSYLYVSPSCVLKSCAPVRPSSGTYVVPPEMRYSAMFLGSRCCHKQSGGKHVGKQKNRLIQICICILSISRATVSNTCTNSVNTSSPFLWRSLKTFVKDGNKAAAFRSKNVVCKPSTCCDDVQKPYTNSC